MIETFLVLLALLNPACKAENKEFMVWSAPGVGIIESDAVPEGRAWIVRAGGLFTDDNNQPADWMIEIIRPVRSQGNACCWRIPVEKSPRAVNTTPLLALSRPIILYEGERLGGRTNAPAKFGINFLYYDVPKSCVP